MFGPTSELWAHRMVRVDAARLAGGRPLNAM
jgi:hypothetical protein